MEKIASDIIVMPLAVNFPFEEEIFIFIVLIMLFYRFLVNISD